MRPYRRESLHGVTPDPILGGREEGREGGFDGTWIRINGNEGQKRRETPEMHRKWTKKTATLQRIS
jgi:hypothetical protein